MRASNSSFLKIAGLRCAVLSVGVVAFVAILAGTSHAQETGPTPIPTDPVVNTPEANPTSGNASPTQTNEKSTGIPTHPVEIIEQMSGWLVPFLIASVISVWFTIERVVLANRHLRLAGGPHG